MVFFAAATEKQLRTECFHGKEGRSHDSDFGVRAAICHRASEPPSSAYVDMGPSEHFCHKDFSCQVAPLS